MTNIKVKLKQFYSIFYNSIIMPVEHHASMGNPGVIHLWFICAKKNKNI